jgi:hypothetical protein
MSAQTIDLSDRFRNVYFDTSIYNRLLDDKDSGSIIKAIQRSDFVVIPSIINLCEMLMTTDEERRVKLIRLYHDLRNDFFPLKPDLWLLGESVEAVANGAQELRVNYPIEINDQTKEICSQIKEVAGKSIEEALRAARLYVQKIAKTERLATEEQYFQYLDGVDGQLVLRRLFDSFCKALGCQQALGEGAGHYLIRSPEMPWKYFLESSAYLFYRRAFPQKRFGRRANPGQMDLMQCVYLFWPVRFVVHDGPFFDFLKQLVRLRNYEIRILDYAEFVTELASS